VSVHYEIERATETLGERSVLIEGLMASEWTARQNCGPPYYFKPRKFATRGGAKNYIHKYGLARCEIVRVSSADQGALK
jgi:hypothetical protein